VLRSLPDKLSVAHLLKKNFAWCCTQKFIAVFTKALHWPALRQLIAVNNRSFNQFFKINFNIILLCLGFSSELFPSHSLARRWHCMAINASCLTYTLFWRDCRNIWQWIYIAVPRLKITILCPQGEVTNPADSV